MVLPYRVIAENPLEMIAFEECLVRSWARSEVLLLFYVNSPSIIIGRNQNYWREVAPTCTLPVFRRISGGGAVYHDFGNVNWSFIVPREFHSQEYELSLMTSAISRFGIQALSGKRGAIFVSMYGGETLGKISGTAREFGTRNVLHHGTLLVSANLGTLETSLGGIEVFDDTAIPSVPSTPVNLNRFIPSLTVEEAITSLSVSIAGTMPKEIQPSNYKSFACEDLAQEEYARNRVKFSSREWIKDRSPAFSIVIHSEVEGTPVIVDIKEGKIAAIVALEPSGQKEARYIEYLRLRYVGIQFDFDILKMMGKEQIRTSVQW